MLDVLWGIGGMAGLLLIAFALSSNRRAIRPRTVVGAFALQLLLGVIVLYWGPGRWALQQVSAGFQAVIDTSSEGISFLFGGLLPAEGEGTIFALQVLPVIIFFASLTAVLYHWRILPWIVQLLGGALGVGGQRHSRRADPGCWQDAQRGAGCGAGHGVPLVAGTVPGSWSWLGGVRRVPGSRWCGSGPITAELAACHRGQAAATSASVAPGPRCVAAIDHSVSPRRTTTSRVELGRWRPVSSVGSVRCRARGRLGVHPGEGGVTATRGPAPVEVVGLGSHPGAGALSARVLGDGASPAPGDGRHPGAGGSLASTTRTAATAVPGRTEAVTEAPRTIAAHRRTIAGVTRSRARRESAPSRPGSRASRTRARERVSHPAMPAATTLSSASCSSRVVPAGAPLR